MKIPKDSTVSCLTLPNTHCLNTCQQSFVLHIFSCSVQLTRHSMFFSPQFGRSCYLLQLESSLQITVPQVNLKTKNNTIMSRS